MRACAHASVLVGSLLDVCFCYSAPVGMCIGLVSETTALPRKGVLK